MTAPIYIPSLGRAGIATTMPELDRLGVPGYQVIAEEHQAAAYAARYGGHRVLVLPARYKEEYDAGDTRPLPPGSGAARNFAWDHAEAHGHPWHWVLDDNIICWYYMTGNRIFRLRDGWVFAAMEDFAARWSNAGAAAPEYEAFIPPRSRQPKPFRLNRRVMSCILLRTGTGLRWRLRWNEDIDLSIRLLEAGWCTVNFLAFQQKKTGTQRMPGGNTDVIYAAGTRDKTMMLVRAHPGVVTAAVRFGRPHHVVDWSRWQGMGLTRDPAYVPPGNPPWPASMTPKPGHRPRVHQITGDGRFGAGPYPSAAGRSWAAERESEP